LGYDGSNAYIQSWASKPLYINNQGNNIILNAGSGNVGIGATNPTFGRLQIEGSGNQILALHSTNDDATIRLYYNNVMRWRIYNNPGSGSDLIILDQGQDNGVALYQNTNSWASASDERLKNNVQSLSVLGRLSHYRAVSFDWRSDGRHDVGVIAQELDKVFPELVRRGDARALQNHRLDQRGIWSVDYSKLGAVALGGVKELHVEVSALRALVLSQAIELKKVQDRLARLESGRVRAASR
jgi:hypothetical protein